MGRTLRPRGGPGGAGQHEGGGHQCAEAASADLFASAGHRRSLKSNIYLWKCLALRHLIQSKRMGLALPNEKTCRNYNFMECIFTP
jgi:hypothetical protein